MSVSQFRARGPPPRGARNAPGGVHRSGSTSKSLFLLSVLKITACSKRLRSCLDFQGNRRPPWAGDASGSDCDVEDIFVLERKLAGEFVVIENVCDAYFGL